MRIFLDANILFSAAKSDGAVRTLLRRLIEAKHACWVDGYVVEEARRNLVAKGGGATAALDALLPHLKVGALQAIPSKSVELDWLPDKDRPVLAAAIRLKCQALVTGDRTHFGAGYGKTFGGVTLYSPRQIAEALLSRPD
ncbi:MAG: PIN domain-containing protein [Rhodocyclaceae bacterium]|jgi:predicted nucleic acid-binding protein|nr:PIN domain-containing protein [Rhodocyclaceae bacterium]